MGAFDAVAYQPWTAQTPTRSESLDTSLGNRPPAVVSRIVSPHLRPRSGLYEGAAVRPAAIAGHQSPSPGRPPETPVSRLHRPTHIDSRRNHTIHSHALPIP